MPVFHNGRVYVAVGGDVWQGKNQAWLKCIDACQTADVTSNGELWCYALRRQSCSTPSLFDGLAYVADCAGFVHCVDAETGKPCWTHKAKGQIWGSTLVADGKVYVGTRQRQLCVFAAGRQKRVLSTVQLDSPMTSTPVAANGVLYIATAQKLYAVEVTPD